MNRKVDGNFVVFIEAVFSEKDIRYFTGTIYNSTIVLASAVINDAIRVYVSLEPSGMDKQEIPANHRNRFHSQYTQINPKLISPYNVIALKLRTALPLGDSVGYVQFSDKNVDKATQYTLFGYGRDNANDKLVLKRGEVFIVDGTDCAAQCSQFYSSLGASFNGQQFYGTILHKELPHQGQRVQASNAGGLMASITTNNDGKRTVIMHGIIGGNVAGRDLIHPSKVFAEYVRSVQFAT